MAIASYAYDALGRLASAPLGSYAYGDTAHVDAATAIGAVDTFAVGDAQAVAHNCPQGGVGAVNKGQRGVDTARDILAAQGTADIQTEVTFETPGARTRVDLASVDGDTLTVAEAKNGPGARLTANPSAAYPFFADSDVANIMPVGENARLLGLEPGVPLAEQGISNIAFRLFWAGRLS